MGVYTGWQDDLLGSASLPKTQHNRDFLNAWHDAATSDCKLNPIDLTEPIKDTGSNAKAHSHNCQAITLPRGLVHFQSYDDRIWTRTAFAAQITSGDYPHLRAALEYGNPYDTRKFDLAAVDKIAADLGEWGSDGFGNDYINLMFAGGTQPTLKAPQALKGWADMQKQINHRLPNTLNESARIRRHALRQLDRARKVRL